MDKVDVIVIGAGVVGLAIASRLANNYGDVILVEKESSFGQGISSRNSEVIHAGMYYPANSLKAKTCLEGNKMLYETCQKNKIPFGKIGKLIVAVNKEEEEQINIIYKQGKINGVSGLEIIDSKGIKKLEPNIQGSCALFSKETGIVDSHKLMDYFCKKAKENAVGVAYQSQVESIERESSSYKIEVKENRNNSFEFTARVVINAAGLNSDLIAAMAGMDIKKLKYELKYCKGEYFRLSSEKSRLINRLIYPVPKQTSGGLGIHLTPDISGQVRLGPDDEYLKEREEDYNIDNNKRDIFFDSVRKFAPFIERNDITADMSGIRPKLQGPQDSFRDFIIKEESDNGFPRFINLIGIESPGLTASLSIAKYVENILNKIV
ncbi:MAG: NAD(P)/FAD-dependent oxidoreductase [Candidatus Omnitrophica bacterium]|nr:NAD(P)/FAD-dependent oxidoreductase [Candidatus Omnitrophota bacterium]